LTKFNYLNTAVSNVETTRTVVIRLLKETFKTKKIKSNSDDGGRKE